ncbi:UNVERIFIED_CONTAM: hypothetical protein GTU68_022502 [Idotea baltica]|nr:hypothetical protein [Idotea baltica]
MSSSLIEARGRFGDNNRLFGKSLPHKTVALVLAGGRGSRLEGLTDWRAKPAVPFGGKYRLIDFALSNCLNSGIGRVGILTQYMSHSLNQHVQQGWGMTTPDGAPLMQLLPAQQRTKENNWYAGTADAIYQNLDIIRGYDAEYVLVLAGDHIYKMDYQPLLEQHVRTEADMTICAIETNKQDAKQFGVLGIDQDGSVLRFSEKPNNPETIPGFDDTCLSSMGVYVFNAKLLYQELINGHEGKGSGDDFGKDVIPSLIGKRKVMSYAFRDEEKQTSAYWRDVGTLDAFWQANLELIGVIPPLNLYDTNWPIRTFATQAPPAKFVFDSEDRCGAAVNSMICDGCIISGARIKNSVVCNNVVANERTEIDECVILPDCTIGEHCALKRVVLDRRCEVPNGLIIGYDHELDAQRFHVSAGGIVLVTQEMIEKLFVNDDERVAA